MTKTIFKILFLLLTGFFFTFSTSIGDPNTVPRHYQADVIIYGDTSGAVTAAVQAARMGKSVIMVSPDVHQVRLGAVSEFCGYSSSLRAELLRLTQPVS